jgi:MtN3 and saliva related transmembrane protein
MDWITILGLVSACFTTFALLPQVIKSIKTKETKDLSFGMYSIFAIGLILWLFYGAFKRDLPVIFANSVSLVLTIIILSLKLKYK